MTTPTTDIQAALIDFIRDELLGSRAPAELKPEDDLLSSGLVDSLGVMSIIAFIERRLGIAVPPSDLTIENFMTVARITSYLTQRGG